MSGGRNGRRGAARDGATRNQGLFKGGKERANAKPKRFLVTLSDGRELELEGRFSTLGHARSVTLDYMEKQGLRGRHVVSCVRLKGRRFFAHKAPSKAGKVRTVSEPKPWDHEGWTAYIKAIDPEVEEVRFG